MPKMSIELHRLVSANFIESPNQSARPADGRINLLVIHNISLPPGEFGGDSIMRLFCNTLNCSAHPYFRRLEGLRVSAHVLIRRNGDTMQFVPFNRKAWHAGRSSFEGIENCNDFSIGVELEGTDHDPFTDSQYAALTQLTRDLLAT
ncbi:MAG: 1,6-anhydro-N-acetylmuramyl-L-alanine amidase AmpD, partial [Pseudomonadota bacterium]|nr:1,6-anhydro-N-acetylmuramyl-L-alanine amidase AmpD [Pseudomonadota bacterium]